MTLDRHRSHDDLGLRRRQFQSETGIAVSQFHCQTAIAALSVPEFHTGIRADRAISVFRPEREPLQSCKHGMLRFQRGLHSLQRCFRLPCTQIPLPPHSLQITFCLPCTQRALPGVSYFKFQAKAANIQLLPQTQQSHLLELKDAVAAGMVDRNQLPVTSLARALPSLAEAQDSSSASTASSRSLSSSFIPSPSLRANSPTGIANT